MEVLEKSDSASISQLFTSALTLLWPSGIRYNRVRLFVTDAAPYMKKAAKGLQILFPEMLHVTCLAHALHRIAEEIRTLYPTVDSLISNGKKIFLKAPRRTQLFRELAPDLSLPPQPVLTRWGTWLSAALYYAENYDAFKNIVTKLDEDEAASIGAVQKLFDSNSLSNELAYLAAHFSCLPSAITALENRELPLTENLKIFSSAISSISAAPGKNGHAIRAKCQKVISANPDLNKLKDISAVLEGEEVAVDMQPDIIACFKYAPVTSAEVERSFSILNNVLSDRRQNFTVDNLRKVLVIMCNSNNK